MTPRTITEPPHATPHLHGNGSAAERLKQPLEEAYGQAAWVLDRLRESRPNPRDYDGPMDAAIAQADYRESLVNALRDSLEAEIGRIDAQTRRD